MAKIYLGEQRKETIIKDYIENNGINKVFVIGEPISNYETIKFSDTIMYKHYYRLLQEINKDTLIILNECLKKQNRYDLTYNCIRKYVLQTPHRIIFNYYPIIKNQEDIMILYDMLQNNPFLKEPYKYISKFENIEIGKIDFNIERFEIKLSKSIEEEYQKQKEIIINSVNKDPNIIPRKLLKFSESVKPKGFDKLNVIKPNMKICISQLKVDEYYYNELLNFRKELENVIQRIQGR